LYINHMRDSTYVAMNPQADPVNYQSGEVALTSLKPGNCAKITAVGSREDLERLKAMGLCLGRLLEVVKSGDPLIIRIYGTRIGLSSRLAAQVQVQICGSAPRCWQALPLPTGKSA
jgi:Fe2+ transport system protein FeoA